MCLGSNSESLYMIPRLHMLIQALFFDISINQCGWRNIKAPSAQNVIHLAGSNTDYWSNIFVLTSFVRWGDSDLFTPPPATTKLIKTGYGQTCFDFVLACNYPYMEIGGADKKCVWISNTMKTWSDAKKHCEDNGSYLITFNSKSSSSAFGVFLKLPGQPASEFHCVHKADLISHMWSSACTLC